MMCHAFPLRRRLHDRRPAGDFTWRYRMWQHLRSDPRRGAYAHHRPAHRAVRHRGERPASHAYADPAFPRAARRHLAGWGEGWLHMAPVIADTVTRRTRADVLLVSLGLIDLGFYTDSEQTAANARPSSPRPAPPTPDVRAVLLPVIPNVRAEHRRPLRRRMRPLQRHCSPRPSPTGPPRAPRSCSPPARRATHLHGHLRRHPPRPHRRTPPRRRLRRRDAPGVGRRAARTPERWRPPDPSWAPPSQHAARLVVEDLRPVAVVVGACRGQAGDGVGSGKHGRSWCRRPGGRTPPCCPPARTPPPTSAVGCASRP